MADEIRFYLDEHVHTAVARGLRERGIDVLTSPEAHMLGVPDQAHLTLAYQERRVIFTQDRDFLRLHQAGQPHAGIVYAPQKTPIGQIIRGLMLIHSVLEPQEMFNHIEFL